MNLVLGLGNPGKRYEKTPHNVGLYLVDSLAASSLWKKSGNSAIQKVFIKKNPAILAKPSTYMNLSGEAARFLLSYYRISSSELIAVVDDANRGGKMPRRMGSNRFCFEKVQY
jgi:PTH1 family peptidyl-tRNA hydrolase